ncbi:hypothetical protein DNTS_014841 [Danionella cerebrum]|uniref:C-type lectin domain-containing protein n=1 Tax=Danionella cerebrum TaxID=2873325 RepID=A0A553QIR4_9TELE|nr:hypothetical protein DNTS_014841 [Danionella translucida]
MFAYWASQSSAMLLTNHFLLSTPQASNCCPVFTFSDEFQLRLRRFYKILNPLTMNEARNCCVNSNYTDLVTIYSQTENMNLKKMVLNQPTSGSLLIGGTYCRWLDGNPVTFHSFGPKMVKFSFSECCAAMDFDGKWLCDNCPTPRFFMCFKRDVKQQLYIHYLVRENKTWEDAWEHCRREAADLVSIRNHEENQQVMQAANGGMPFWIGARFNATKLSWIDGGHSDFTANTSNNGCFAHIPYKGDWSEEDQIETVRELKRNQVSEPVWIGLRQSRLFSYWFWVSGYKIKNYSNWKDGKAPEPYISQYCGVMDDLEGEFKWSDKNCMARYRALCEVPESEMRISLNPDTSLRGIPGTHAHETGHVQIMNWSLPLRNSFLNDIKPHAQIQAHCPASACPMTGVLLESGPTHAGSDSTL